ncbi:hypothetical protein ABNX05_02315 [Lysinibacillus sp. M3]|uniref:ParB/Sulfiredoxin domain-containing protein n=1 Tax=Lysinibacillus zambalensis TaxID=3160866 RepID=A0ABV1MP84_9BACI
MIRHGEELEIEKYNFHFSENECSAKGNGKCFFDNENEKKYSELPDTPERKQRGDYMYCPYLAKTWLHGTNQRMFSPIKIYDEMEFVDGRHRFCISHKLNQPFIFIDSEVYENLENISEELEDNIHLESLNIINEIEENIKPVISEIPDELYYKSQEIFRNARDQACSMSKEITKKLLVDISKLKCPKCETFLPISARDIRKGRFSCTDCGESYTLIVKED